MHSLSIIGSDRMREFSRDEIEVSFGEFGWGYETLRSPLEKLSYIVTEYSDNDSMLDLVKEAVMDYTGAELIIKECDDEWYEKGYIDHGSKGMITEYISDKQSIIDIVFNDKNTIIIDNDNH